MVQLKASSMRSPRSALQISIPHGTIKRTPNVACDPAYLRFQYLMVQLKERNHTHHYLQ